MATLAELIRQHTEISKDDTAHLQQLIGEWGMLADLCFADMLLHLPAENGSFVVGAQVRPATGQTIYRHRSQCRRGQSARRCTDVGADSRGRTAQTGRVRLGARVGHSGAW
jgi:hypothetical protein